MRNKNTWINFGIGLGAYLLLILLVRYNIELFKFTPVLLVVGALVMYMMIGLIQRSEDKWGGRIAVVLPYILSGGMYIVARIGQNTELIALFRNIVPQVYQPLNKITKMMHQEISRDGMVAILMIVFVVLALFMLEIGRRIGNGESNMAKFFYNNVLVWGMHFYLFLVIHALILAHPVFMSNHKMRNLFAVGTTLIIFIVYFLVGRACKTIRQQLVQFLSCMSVSLTALMMYGLGNLLVWDIGIYERYILPVAASFIGTMCKGLGNATGAAGIVISQYGVVATLIMISVPTILIFVGKLASIPEENAEEKTKVEAKVGTGLE